MEFTKKEAANMASEMLHTYTNTYICQKESRAPREGGNSKQRMMMRMMMRNWQLSWMARARKEEWG